ncbi:hypothetical protein H6P81_014234 [Aristolochia fimbriata]|uniref:Uncharacterized protein n=1 Tax=Aristolochia fimbriata TaxID=158543 RepID=A0AAV7EJQ3_ARIFI|nr:hypothetical protein H6P81_014234 [Aristolochia fimbriata]
MRRTKERVVSSQEDFRLEGKAVHRPRNSTWPSSGLTRGRTGATYSAELLACADPASGPGT